VIGNARSPDVAEPGNNGSHASRPPRSPPGGRVTPRLQAFLIVGAVATVVTLGAVPLCRRLALRVGVIVAPDERRVHALPTPLLGGLGMAVGLFAGLLVASQLGPLRDIFVGPTEPYGVVVASLLMLLVGTVDDIREVSPPAKTAGTVLCASVLVYSGVSLLYFPIPLIGVVFLDPTWSYLLSVIWVYGMTTATNLIDGLDGLAAGIMAIAAGTFFLYTLRLGDDGTLPLNSVAPLVAIILVGICVGFLPYNFHPAKIFMGDGGALMLGLLMAAATMVVGGRIGNEATAPGQTWFFFAPIFIPLMILGVPILDTALSIVRRLVSHRGATTADKDHIHHRLMRLGHGQRRSVGILWGWTILLSVLALYRNEVLVPVVVGAVLLSVYTVAPRLRDRRRPPAPPPEPPAAGLPSLVSDASRPPVRTVASGRPPRSPH
jgi:UDP-GlcNAc:undecaprenyl-phosphate GlcNAc-1-phosphate transferase